MEKTNDLKMFADLMDLVSAIHTKYTISKADALHEAIEIKRLCIETDRNSLIKEAFISGGSNPPFLEAMAIQLGYKPDGDVNDTVSRGLLDIANALRYKDE